MANKRILIADNSPKFLEPLKELLEGYCSEWKVCAQAYDGLDAIEKTVKSRPDLAILSLELPSPEGLDPARRIREYLPSTRILMLTRRRSESPATRKMISRTDPRAILEAVRDLLS